jgi:hypothetical protein
MVNEYNCYQLPCCLFAFMPYFPETSVLNISTHFLSCKVT